jgi:tetratricopeptide (TPR) repeat protein
MNKILIVGFIVSTAVGASAQTLQDAKKKVVNERYEMAREDFKSLIAKDPTSIDNAFFYGNFLVKIDDNKGAIEQFRSAASKNAEDKLAMVSGAKATYFAGDTTSAGIKFREIIKTTKNKNVCVLFHTAETYATGPVKNLPLAEKYLNRVIELEPANIQALQLLGDVIIDITTSRVSESVAKYNTVLKLEPTNVEALVKKSYIYERVGNKSAAIEGYEQAIKLDPNFGPAYRHEAEVQMAEGNAEKSAELWTKYLELNNDPQARYRYATSLFIGKKYADAIKQLEAVEKSGISNTYTKRMIFYSLYEMNTTGDVMQYEKALKASNDLFAIADPKLIIASDYQYLAKIYQSTGKTSEAISTLAKGASLDPTAVGDQLSLIGNTAAKAGQYKVAIEAYNAKNTALPTLMKATDFFDLGRAYYYDDTKNFVMADSAFAMLTRVSPTYALGYLWRGRAMAQMDLDLSNRNWKAQPHYEMFFEKLTEQDRANPAYKDYITEASLYLGDYYVNSPAKDAVKAKMYWQQVLTNDPTNKQAQIYFKNH